MKLVPRTLLALLIVLLSATVPAPALADSGADLPGLADVAAVAAGVAIATVRLFDGIAPADPGKVFEFLKASVAAVVAGLAYLGVSLVLRIPELPTMISIVTDVVRRRGRRDAAG